MSDSYVIDAARFKMIFGRPGFTAAGAKAAAMGIMARALSPGHLAHLGQTAGSEGSPEWAAFNNCAVAAAAFGDDLYQEHVAGAGPYDGAGVACVVFSARCAFEARRWARDYCPSTWSFLPATVGRKEMK